MTDSSHVFSSGKEHLERKTFAVVVITLSTMIVEILVGLFTNSMALFADGLHMGTHTFALGLSLVAYAAARRFSGNERFAFGTWKIEILGAYSSSLVLGVVALMIAYTSVARLINPLEIRYDQAIPVAVLGLLVNIACAVILNGGSGSHDNPSGTHERDNHYHQDHGHAVLSGRSDAHGDLNFKAAYVHVLADALTSILAIAALVGARFFNLTRLDPVMGLAGAVLIGKWSASLMKDSGRILLDYGSGRSVRKEIIDRICSDGKTRLTDLHVLQVADDGYACIVSIVPAGGRTASGYREILGTIRGLVHITVEMDEE